MNMSENPYYEMFRTASIYCLKHKWKDGQKSFAAKVGVSPSTISEVKTGKAIASFDLQKDIAAAFVYKYDDFLKFGRTLILASVTETATARDAVGAFVTTQGDLWPPPGPSNVHLLPAREKSPPTPEEQQAHAAHRNLDVILASGDIELVTAITMNLISFRKQVELQKQIENLVERIKQLELAS
jgi:transcriptional regulator with XRE-family HTH domain